MRKIIITTFSFLFLSSLSVYSQDVSLFEVNQQHIESVPDNSGRALLWDNLLPPTTTGIVSSIWGGLTAPNNRTQCAEDFTVPGDVISWEINEIYAEGFYNPATPATEFHITFFDNNSGIPGNEIATRIITPGPGPGQQGIFTPVSLTPGTYWVTVNGYHPTADTTTEFRWNWYASNSGIGSQPYIRDLSGLFGGIPWTSFTALGIGQFQGLVFALYGNAVIPVELTSFTAKSTGTEVQLNWSTATEVNNHGFEIQRNSGSGFATVAFVQGNGTTTEIKNYTYFDKGLAAGLYSYRLKQLDFSGMFDFSDAVEIDVSGLTEFALIQNYPNPFNPATMISFNLIVDSKVALKVFNLLGQEIVTLLNQDLTAGLHEVNFNADGLNSGVYFYQLEASGIDGKSFSSVKKMILSK